MPLYDYFVRVIMICVAHEYHDYSTICRTKEIEIVLVEDTMSVGFMHAIKDLGIDFYKCHFDYVPKFNFWNVFFTSIPIRNKSIY